MILILDPPDDKNQRKESQRIKKKETGEISRLITLGGAESCYFNTKSQS